MRHRIGAVAFLLSFQSSLSRLFSVVLILFSAIFSLHDSFLARAFLLSSRIKATSCIVDSSFLSDFRNREDRRDFILEFCKDINLPRPVLSYLKGINFSSGALSYFLNVVASV